MGIGVRFMVHICEYNKVREKLDRVGTGKARPRMKDIKVNATTNGSDGSDDYERLEQKRKI